MPQTIRVPGVGDVQFPDGMSDDDITAAIQRNMREQRPKYLPSSPLGEGASEAATNFVTGAIAAPVAGLAGLGSMATNALGMTNTEPANVVRGVQGAMTYQPRTQAGQKAAGFIAYPFEKLAQGADFVGRNVAEVSDSPALGAAVNAGIQFLPSVVLGKGLKGRAPAQAKAASAAETYVRTRAPGLDWAALPDTFKATLTDIARDPKGLQSLDPVALERQVLLNSLPEPVPATAGQLARDSVRLRNEGNVAATEAGAPIRGVHVAQNEALLRNLEILKRSQGGTATSAEQAGGTVQGALARQLKAKQNEVSSLYKKADQAGETAQTVDATPILDLLKSKPDVTEYGWAQSWMNKMDVREAKPQKPVAQQSSMDSYLLKEPQAQAASPVPKISIRELEKLRQDAGIRTRNGGTEAYYAGRLIDQIDALTEGKGGNLYAAARKARKEQADQFQNRRGVGQLVESETRTDPKVAAEDVWNKTVISGSIQDLRNVKAQILSKGKTGASGQQAWREIRAQTAQFILDQATKTVSNYEGPGLTGTRNVSAAGLERAVNQIGKDKIVEIFGPDSAKVLERIQKATSITKTDPPPSFKGSPTAPNLLAFFERFLSKVPLVGDTAVGAIRGVASLDRMGASTRQVRAAQETPLAAAQDVTANAFFKRKNRNALFTATPSALTAKESR